MNKQLWKKAGRRALIGMPLGLAWSTAITIIISLLEGDGKYYAVVPALIADCGTEINAVLIQAVCSLLYGAAFGAASVIWETNWSLTRMTVTHLAVIALAVMPTAWLMQWMKHTVGGALRYIGIFLVIYAAIWISTYSRMKKQISEINQKMNDIR